MGLKQKIMMRIHNYCLNEEKKREYSDKEKREKCKEKYEEKEGRKIT